MATIFRHFILNSVWCGLALVIVAATATAQSELPDESEEGGIDDGFRLPPSSVTVKPPIAIKGLTAEQIAHRYGEPDSKSGDAAAGRQSWKFGNSVIFFSDDRVAGWSDAGELRERESLQSIRAEKKPDAGDTPFEKDWENPWTPRKNATRGEVLRDIFD